MKRLIYIALLFSILVTMSACEQFTEHGEKVYVNLNSTSYKATFSDGKCSTDRIGRAGTLKSGRLGIVLKEANCTTTRGRPVILLKLVKLSDDKANWYNAEDVISID